MEKTIEQSYPNDVGLWPSEISELFRKFWLHNESKQCQHQNSDFKNSAVIEKDRTRHCTSSCTLLRRIIDVTVFLSTRGLALRGHDEIIGSFHNGNFLGIIKLLSKYDPFLATPIEKYVNQGHIEAHHIFHICICDELINIMAKGVINIIVKEVQ